MRFLYRTPQMAVSALRRHVLRSVLTTLGIVIGVGAVIAMVEIGDGAAREVEATIASMGSNTILVLPGNLAMAGVAGGAGTAMSLTPGDAAAMADRCSALSSVAPLVAARTQVVANGRNWVPDRINGTTPAYLEIRDWAQLADGSMFTEEDVTSLREVCVIGQSVADELYGDESPVGQQLRMNNKPLRVLGVLSRKGANMYGQDQDDIVMLPWTTLKFKIVGQSAQKANQSAAAKVDPSQQVNSLNDEKNVLSGKLGSANAFDAQMAGRMVHDALNGKSMVIFRTPDAKDEDVDAVSKIIGQAGGAVTGTVSLTQEFVDANSAEKLRSVVNASVLPAGAQLSTKLVDQGSQAGDLLGIALLINRDPAIPPVDDAQRDTVLAALRDTGFIGYGNQHVGAANAAAVITGGSLSNDAGNQGVSVARFAAALAPHGSGVVLAGRDGSSDGPAAVGVARADATVTPVISTVDDLDAESGRVTAVLGAADLINGGRTGQYGTGHRNTGLTVAS